MQYVELSFEKVKQDLRLGEDAELWRGDWSESGASYAALEDGFLTPESVEAACRFLRLPSEPAEAIRAAWPLLDANAALKRLLRHAHCLLFERHEKPKTWPVLPAELGAPGHLFQVFVLLAGLPHVQARHRERGIDCGITVDTLGDIEVWMNVYRRLHGVWGFDKVDWLCHHYAGEVIRLGRLQFEPRRWRTAFRIFRNHATGELAALAPRGARFRGDGQFDGVNGGTDPAAWTAHVEDTDDAFRGNPVTVDGRALKEIRVLPKVDWECVLEENGASVGVHIPELGPLDTEACIESFARASSFFPRHYPEHSFQLFECDSWLLDNQLAACLSAESNIIRFQRLFHLLPSPTASDAQTLERVFDFMPFNAATALRDTRLRRIVLNYMAQGGRWRTALGVRALGQACSA